MNRRPASMPAKADLRRQLRAARDALAHAERAARSRRLCQGLLDALAALPGRELTIATYSPIASEVDVAPLGQQGLAGKTLRWALPRIEDGELAFRLGPPSVPGPWQILEPASSAPRLGPGDLSAVIVPGLGFDRRGHRLGYGAGYYDRALARLPPSTRRLGVCFRDQLLPMIPNTDGDVPMHVIVTEAPADADAVIAIPTGATP